MYNFLVYTTQMYSYFLCVWYMQTGREERRVYCTCSGTVWLLNVFFLKNLTVLYFRLELQGSLGKEQLDSLLDFMLYIRRPCFPLSECKRKWKLWASLKSWKCSMCQFHSLNTWIESLVWGHLANKTRLFSALQIFCIKFPVTFDLSYAQQYSHGYYTYGGDWKRKVGNCRKSFNIVKVIEAASACLLFYTLNLIAKIWIRKISDLIQRDREVSLGLVFFIFAFTHVLRCNTHYSSWVCWTSGV